jgi:hypothetical protein
LSGFLVIVMAELDPAIDRSCMLLSGQASSLPAKSLA